MKVFIARSDALTRWLRGSTNYSFILSSPRYFFTGFEATLSMMLKTGLKPLFVRYVMFSLNVSIVEVSIRSSTGFSNIVFDDQLYSTNIAVLPYLDLIGNFPVQSTYIFPFFELRVAW